MTRETFVQQYRAIVQRAIAFNELALSEGIAALNSRIWDVEATDDRDIFKYGIVKVIDGAAPDYVEKLLGNLIQQEKDKDRRVLKTIQKEAVLCIQNGCDTKMMLSMLNSYTGISLYEQAALLDELMISLQPPQEETPDEAQYEREEGKYDGEV